MSPSTQQQTPTWEDEETLREVRPRIRQLLASSKAYGDLDPSEQESLARDLVRVSSYLVKPEGHRPEELVAEAQANPPTTADTAGDKATADKGFAGEDFQAGAARQYTDAFKSLVGAVDFPAFVGGLINNVFTAIVDSSIKQMKAYGELISGVAKSVDAFAQDNISDNNARDWLAQKYPGQVGIDTKSMSGGMADGAGAPGPQPRVTITADDPEAAMLKIGADLGWSEPPTDLSDEASEAELVRRAKLQLARQRQQLLSSMVMLGINRIVVTDGHINAKVIFDMRASDEAHRGDTASAYDSQAQSHRESASVSAGGWLSPVDASLTSESRNSHVATVASAVDETSESKGQIKANLTGDVKVNFKSDYFPMEKMASPEMIAAIQGNAVPTSKPVAATAPPPAPANA